MSLSRGDARFLAGGAHRGFRNVIRNQRGGAVALIALFLPVAVLCVGMVLDLGLVLTARHCVQAACDLGALAGLQELDWDALARGDVVIVEDKGRQKAVEIAASNVEDVRRILSDVSFHAEVRNGSSTREPSISVEATFKVRTVFLRWLPGLENGVMLKTTSVASVLQRSKW
ncbi:MAG: Tad domain-containing protein [Candidatus Fermentithermobacillus carboniphilus]|uniref:Tad domain-containing protein n=1 Tax=Candidatus Fermentithermobacillus carboniphilus TaxID=3085328 RepID=A0AAT9LBF3_9FIRM|nr:MAG: Tad domain-containing protein [Candidatus Fermentithermobacillus carboniphilus]